MTRIHPKLVLGAAVGAAITLGCAKAPPPPAAATAEVPLSGQHEMVDKVDSHKYIHYAIGENIQASPADVWNVITDADGYPAWNSTVRSLEGTIAKDEVIALEVKISKRTFKLEVTEFDEPTRMVWEDGNDAFKGTRTFTLTEREDGSTDYTMKEILRGSMMKMIAPKLPDFGPDFDAFAADLKKEAEARYPLPEPELETEPPASDEVSAAREIAEHTNDAEPKTVTPAPADEGTAVKAPAEE